MLRLITASALLAALASAQTFTTCNPLKGTCPSDTGLASSSLSTDFTAGVSSNWTPMYGTALTYGSTGADFKITASGQGPTIQSNFYIFFGRVDVTMQAAPGTGIVSSIVLQSDDLDEIDWEFLGGDTTQGQSNFFGKGDTTTYDRGAYHPVSAPQSTFHTYSIDWTADRINWLVDGTVVRTVPYAAAVAKGGAEYPQTPMMIKIGSWVAGGQDSPPGTVQWAGGYTDFSQAPFNMYVKSIQVTNYNPAASYTYGDQSGSWKSIQMGGAVAGSSPAASSAAAITSSVAPQSSFTTVISTSSTSVVSPVQSSTSVMTSTLSTTSTTAISTTTSKSTTVAIAAVSSQPAASSGFLTQSRTSSSATATSTGPVLSTGGASSLGVSAAGSLLGLAAALMMM